MKIFQKNSIVLSVSLLAACACAAYDLPIKFRWSGWVALDSFTDSHESLTTRDGLFLFYPFPKTCDVHGTDIYDYWKYTLTAVKTRLRWEAEGPEIRGLYPKMLIEGDFNGTDEANVGGFRLRHAIVTFEGKKDRVMLGQYWSPLGADDCMPGVVSFNGGAPIDWSVRSPQIRWTHKIGNVELVPCVIMPGQNSRSTGPEGRSGEYLRRAVIPNLHFQLRHVTESHILAVGVDYKRLVPRIVDIQDSVKQAVSEWVDGVSFLSYAKFMEPKFTLIMKCLYGQNMEDQNTIGGYAVTSIDPLNGRRCYAPLQTVHALLDIGSTNKCIAPGIFIGGVKNIGTRKRIYLNSQGLPKDPAGLTTFYGREPFPNVDYVVRVSPRLVWKIHQFTVGCEAEFTRAAFGDLSCKAKIINSVPVNNIRLLLSLFYNF